MDMTNSMSREKSVYLDKYDRGTFLPSAGQRSRAIVRGDDPGDQQPPEQRPFCPDPGVAVPRNRLPRPPAASPA